MTEPRILDTAIQNSCRLCYKQTKDMIKRLRRQCRTNLQWCCLILALSLLCIHYKFYMSPLLWPHSQNFLGKS